MWALRKYIVGQYFITVIFKLILRLLKRMRTRVIVTCFSRSIKWVKLTCCITLAILTVVACYVHVYTIATSFHCIHFKTTSAITRLCDLHRDGLAFGDLCSDLCADPDSNKNDDDNVRRPVIILSCYTSHLNKDIVITAKWRERRVVIKTKYIDIDKFDPLPQTSSDNWGDDDDDDRANAMWSSFSYTNMLRAVGRLATHNYGDKFSHQLIFDRVHDMLLLLNNSIMTSKTVADDVTVRREQLIRNVWLLFQQYEFMMFQVFNHVNIFPRVRGTCGHYYAVDYHEPVSDLVAHVHWNTRVDMTLMITQLLDELETMHVEPLRTCDVKLEHFGMDFERHVVRILDSDNVYLQSAIKSIIVGSMSEIRCESDFDCSLFDCRMICDRVRNVCNETSVNSNLQVVCERLLLPSASSWHPSVFQPYVLHSIPDGLQSKVTALMSSCSHFPPSAMAHEIKALLVV